MHEIKVDFRIIGFDCSVDEITLSLGVEPTKVQLKGESISNQSARTRKDNIWILESFSDSKTDIEAHLEDIAEKIRPRIDEFKIVCKKFYSEFACRMYLQSGSDQSIPSVHLTKTFNNLLNELGSDLDIDIYII